MKAVGYVRVSTEDQAREGVSLDNQTAKIKAYAELKDLDLMEIVADAGISAKNLNRPGVQRVLDMARKKEVGAVVVFLGGVVVVAVHAEDPPDRLTDERVEGGHDVVEHRLPVLVGVRLCPLEVCPVVVELGGVLDEVGEVGVGNVDEISFHQPLGDADVVLCELVADASRPGMEDNPHVFVGV